MATREVPKTVTRGLSCKAKSHMHPHSFSRVKFSVNADRFCMMSIHSPELRSGMLRRDEQAVAEEKPNKPG
jgi:hypothetical protein